MALEKIALIEQPHAFFIALRKRRRIKLTVKHGRVYTTCAETTNFEFSILNAPASQAPPDRFFNTKHEERI
jgi:hypothetical protein